MTIDTELINLHAMCRECAKEFHTIAYPSKLYRVIEKHMRENPGHVVIGSEQTRVIFKVKLKQDAVCIAR